MVTCISQSNSLCIEAPRQGSSRIASIVRDVFEKIRDFFSFPIRYFGSKTWSIPGLIFRTPYLLFKKIFSSEKFSFKEELFQSEYRFSIEKNLTKTELKSYYPYGCAPGYTYGLNPDYIPHGWSVVKPVFYNPQSGLKISFLQKGDEVILTFGSVEAKELKPKRNELARGSLLGMNPDLYKEASQRFSKLSSDPLLKGKKITLAGSCLGAAIASYVALKHKTKAVCFNSFPLGVGQQYDLGNERLRKAPDYITHISAKGDYTSDIAGYPVVDRILSAIGFRTPGHFGKRFRIPSAYKSMHDTHAYVIGNIMQHLGRDKRTKPVDL
jgi:hypothetical protein